MGKIDKEELQKLTLSERIKRLKELEEENKKEIEEAGKLIRETESQIEREKIAVSVAVPETKPIDITELFKEERRDLETAVRTEAEDVPKEENVLYQLAQDYGEAKGILYSQEPLDKEQLEWVDRLGERVEKIKYYATSDQIANLAVATRSLIHKIKKYHQQ